MIEALALEDLHFGYGRRACVRGVSLRLFAGDCYGFLGHNGAGKTTIMRLCLGLLRPRRGRVRVFGLDALRRRRAANALTGALIERPGFHLRATAFDNLAALARLQGISRRLARVEAERVLDVVALSESARQRVSSFSMGMRQRLGIAQALLGGPRLLLLDEPTSGLDPEGIAELRALLLRLTRDDGVAVMLSSHQLAELEGLCSRIGVLRDGAMVVEGDLDSLRRRLSTRQVVTGRPLPELARALEALDLSPVADGDRLLVDLGARTPGEVARALANAGELSSFAPEQATLERIYLQAGNGLALPDVESEPSPGPTPAGAVDEPAPRPRLGSVERPWRRSFAYEAEGLLRRRQGAALLLVPGAVAAFSVHSYAGRVGEAMALVESEERFSADAGSGFLALAQGLQNATPVLALVLLWLASQTVAADLANDTLRNSLARSLRRRDVLAGKLGVLLAATMLGWLALLGAGAATSALFFGFGDLEEVSRYGDRDLLAAVEEVWPTMLTASAQVLLPLVAIAAIGAAASALARRPARALALALLLALVPELLRGSLGEDAGWLLSSHLPILWRDDSVLGYCAATARGAADALWPWAELSVIAPLLWFAGGAAALGAVLARMRIR